MQDNLQINETIKGYYFLEQDGKIIAKGHNLIVNDGRDFIFKRLAYALGLITQTNANNITESDESKRTFYKIYAGGKTIESGKGYDYMTVPGTTFEDVEHNQIEDLACDIPVSGTNSNITFDTDVANRRFKLTLNLVGTSEAYCITEFFITTAIDGTDEKLFSRFLIDPIYLTAGSTYNLVYYIGF